MNSKLPVLLLALGFATACTGPLTTLPPSASGYTPDFKRVPEGYHATIPSYFPNISYVNSQALTAAQIREIQQDFYYPLVRSEYRNLLGALVINGAPTAARTTFTIWLLDGRRLDSGPLMPFATPDFGVRFYTQAISMLRAAIPPGKLQEARRAS